MKIKRGMDKTHGIGAVRPWATQTASKKSSHRKGSPAKRSRPAASLRRHSEKETSCLDAVAGYGWLNQHPLNNLGLPAQTGNIARRLFHLAGVSQTTNTGKIVPAHQHPMGVSKPSDNHHEPICHQPWRYSAVGIHSHRCTVKTPLPRLP